MFPRAPQGLKPLFNTPRDGTTEVVPSRTHQYRKLIFHRRREDTKNDRILFGNTSYCYGELLLGAHASCVPGVRNAEPRLAGRSQGLSRLGGEIRFGCGYAAPGSFVSLRLRGG